MNRPEKENGSILLYTHFFHFSKVHSGRLPFSFLKNINEGQVGNPNQPYRLTDFLFLSGFLLKIKRIEIIKNHERENQENGFQCDGPHNGNHIEGVRRVHVLPGNRHHIDNKMDVGGNHNATMLIGDIHTDGN